MARTLVALCYVRVFLPPGVKGSWFPLMAHLPEVACNACLFPSMELACLWSDTYGYDAIATTCLQRYCLEDSCNPLLSFVDFNVWMHYRRASSTCC